MKYIIYFFSISFTVLNIQGMGLSDDAPKLPLPLHAITKPTFPLTRTKSYDLKKNPDEDMLSPNTLATKVPSPRGTKGCSGSPRQEGRVRASSLSRDTTAEFLAIKADCSK